MYYVKARHLGEDGLGMFDPDRRDRLPANCWRRVPANTYWVRAAATGDVFLRFDAPPDSEIEGYVAPSPVSVPSDDVPTCSTKRSDG